MRARRNRDSASWNAACSTVCIVMAYLNVRERRLETKIAYVGAELSGRATNFERLGGGHLGDDVLALDWTPRSAPNVRFRDCEVRVRLVTSRGAPTGEQMIELLRDADGVVFVADAHPSAESRNRDSLALVREALSTRVDREVPVVVQVNKTDLPDSVAPEELAERLEVGAWPLIKAAAVQGEGVVETVERAVETMLDALTKNEANGSASRPRNDHSATAGASREGNPMLAALRQVLRETVFAQVEELESRLTGKLEQLLRGERRANEETSGGPRVSAESAELVRALASLQAQIETLQEKLDAATSTTSSTLREIGAELWSQRAELGAMAERLRALDARTDAIATTTSSLLPQREALVAVRERIDASRRAAEDDRSALERWRREVDAKLDAAAKERANVADTIAVLELGLRTSATELLGALEASARAEADQRRAAEARLERVLDSVVSDVKVADTRMLLTPMKTSLEAVAHQATTLVSAVKPVAALATRLEQTEAALKRELRTAIEIVAGKIDAAHDETTTALASADAKSVEIHALVAGIDEEIKKPKKGWFA